MILSEITYTPEQARKIGSCAIIAMSIVTGLSWEEVWEHAQKYFSRYGMHSGQIYSTMRDLGWSYGDKKYWKLIGAPNGKPMTVRQAQLYLQQNDPDVKLICTINVGGVAHSIAFSDGKFHNVMDSWKSRIRMASYCEKL